MLAGADQCTCSAAQQSIVDDGLLGRLHSRDQLYCKMDENSIFPFQAARSRERVSLGRKFKPLRASFTTSMEEVMFWVPLQGEKIL